MKAIGKEKMLIEIVKIDDGIVVRGEFRNREIFEILAVLQDAVKFLEEKQKEIIESFL